MFWKKKDELLIVTQLRKNDKCASYKTVGTVTNYIIKIKLWEMYLTKLTTVYGRKITILCIIITVISKPDQMFGFSAGKFYLWYTGWV